MTSVRKIFAPLAMLWCLLTAPAVQAKPPLPLRPVVAYGRLLFASWKDEYGFRDKLYSSTVIAANAAEATDMAIELNVQRVCRSCYEGGPFFHGQSLYVSNLGGLAFEQLLFMPLSSWLHRKGEATPGDKGTVLYGLSALAPVGIAGVRAASANASWPFYVRVREECAANPKSCL